MPNLVELDGVVKFYGPVQALGPITLTLPDASVGLLGPNGAGKTTLIRMLLGVMAPTSGTVRVLGEEVGPGANAVRRRIGYVPEGDALFPDLTGVEAVTYAGRLVGMPKAEALSRAHQVLDYVGLEEARYRLVETFSTGMRQRLKLAQALVHDPELLILDEPTEGVDPQARLQILDLLAELEKEHGLKLLLSTHILHDVERLATHALVVHRGRAVAFGSIEELKQAPSKAYLVRGNAPAEDVAAAFSAAGVRHETAAPNVRVDLDDPRQILKILQERGIVVRHLAPMTLSLEEAFEQAVAGADVGEAPREVVAGA